MQRPEKTIRQRNLLLQLSSSALSIDDLKSIYDKIDFNKNIQLEFSWDYLPELVEYAEIENRGYESEIILYEKYKRKQNIISVIENISDEINSYLKENNKLREKIQLLEIEIDESKDLLKCENCDMSNKTRKLITGKAKRKEIGITRIIDQIEENKKKIKSLKKDRNINEEKLNEYAK